MQRQAAGYYADIASQMAPGTVGKVSRGARAVWIKRASQDKSKIWHGMQYLCSFVVLNPIVRPTVSAGGVESLAAEAARLEAFADAGIYVPNILQRGEDFLVLSDAGVELKSHLSALGNEQHAQRTALLKRAVKELARLHDAGFVHGRPHLKDMVYDRGRNMIGFLDLEEDPLAVMPAEHAQSRDIWLFLCSAARYLKAGPQEVEALYTLYLSERGMPPLRPLRGLVRLLAPLCWVVRRLAYNHVGKDVRHVILVNEALALLCL